jgi:hypothetical protein
MIGRQPLGHVDREQEPLITLYRPEPLRHPTIIDHLSKAAQWHISKTQQALQGQQIATDGGDQLMSSPDHDASPTLSIVDLAEI